MVGLSLAACGPATPGPSTALSTTYATDVALPNPTSIGVSSFSPCPPLVTGSPGIDSNSVQVGPDSYDTFVTTNQWVGPVNGSSVHWYHVYAGATGQQAQPPSVPAIWVNGTTVTSDLCGIDLTAIGTFINRSAHGPLRIAAVNGALVHLSTSAGEHFVFDLATRRYTS
ncbi:MAG: hypothetical protein ABI352_09065 [Candidatus Dormibacter sp.]